jgi:hypothetical protein
MQFAKWIKREGRGALARVARHTGLAYTTVDAWYRDRIKNRTGRTAQLISDATGGEVTLVELLVPGTPPSPTRVARMRQRRTTTTTRTRSRTRRRATSRKRTRAAA